MWRLKQIPGTIYAGPERRDDQDQAKVYVQVAVEGASPVASQPCLYGGVYSDYDKNGKITEKYGKWVALVSRLPDGFQSSGWPQQGDEVIVYEAGDLFWAEPLYQSIPDDRVERLGKFIPVVSALG
jgi:hypothetical protein